MQVAEAFRVAKLFRGGEQLSPARVSAGENPSELVVYLHHRYNFFNLKEVVRNAADGRWGRAKRGGFYALPWLPIAIINVIDGL